MEDGSELIVENKNKKIEEQEEVKVVDVREMDTKDIPIPPVGTIFMFNGCEYRVCYINEGKRRFSAEPFRGKYS